VEGACAHAEDAKVDVAGAAVLAVPVLLYGRILI
jgi:hypothetical protein